MSAREKLHELNEARRILEKKQRAIDAALKEYDSHPPTAQTAFLMAKILRGDE
jgi:hypothetical protein